MMMEEDKRREKCVEECLKSSVMVKVSIKDARQRVAGKSSFFLRNKGQTCRSASGVFVADNVVLSEASILSPFVVVPTTTSNFDDNANGQHQPSIRTDGGDCAPPPSSSSSSRCCSHPPLSLHEDVEAREPAVAHTQPYHRWKEKISLGNTIVAKQRLREEREIPQRYKSSSRTISVWG
mmetsp:Transcript_13504/g.22579  ORF Transcript_13504/g.22579 Transcript_13504/m.22579 type:complete len:179 (+) Transcript_13504:95-631(+)